MKFINRKLIIITINRQRCKPCGLPHLKLFNSSFHNGLQDSTSSRVSIGVSILPLPWYVNDLWFCGFMKSCTIYIYIVLMGWFWNLHQVLPKLIRNACTRLILTIMVGARTLMTRIVELLVLGLTHQSTGVVCALISNASAIPVNDHQTLPPLGKP